MSQKKAINSLKTNNWVGRRESKDVSKFKKRHVHTNSVDERTNIVTTTVKVKTEFDVKVEAKTEVKSDDIGGKKWEEKRCGIAEHAGHHCVCFKCLHMQIKFIYIKVFKIKCESP